MNLIVSLGASKQLADIPVRDRAAMLAKVASFAADPFGTHPWALQLKGRVDVFRVREGDWRAICRVDRTSQTVVVDAVAHRREVYR